MSTDAGDDPTPDGSVPFRLEFVPGVTPDKWLRVWARRRPDSRLEAVPVEDDDAVAHLHDRTASMALVRLPVERRGLHVIPLYEELPVVVVAKEHVLSAFEEVDVADLADEVLMQRPSSVPEWAAAASAVARERSEAMPPMTTKQAVSVVATGSGIVILPMSLARLHHRKDVVHRPVTGVAPSGVGLAWRTDDEDPRLDDFIGIVRGRTERSSRGTSADTEPPSTRTGRTDEPTRSGTGDRRPARGQRHRGQPARRQQPGRGRGGSAGARGRRKGGR